MYRPKQPILKSKGPCWLGCIVSGTRETLKSKISLSDRSVSLKVYQMPKILQDLTSLESWHNAYHFIFCCDDCKVTIQCQMKMLPGNHSVPQAKSLQTEPGQMYSNILLFTKIEAKQCIAVQNLFLSQIIYVLFLLTSSSVWDPVAG